MGLSRKITVIKFLIILPSFFEENFFFYFFLAYSCVAYIVLIRGRGGVIAKILLEFDSPLTPDQFKKTFFLRFFS